MACAHERDIVFPNKKKEEQEKFYNGHLLNSETYIGGRVECLRNGVYREDIPSIFNLDKEAYNLLINNVDSLLDFVIRVECNSNVDEVENYQEVSDQIVERLTYIRD